MTTIEQILGTKCLFKQRQPLDKCRECTGYRCYAKEIQCENYVSYSRQTKQSSQGNTNYGRSELSSVPHGDKSADTKLNEGIENE